MRIAPFEPEFQDQVIDLIVGIQRAEFGLAITADGQPHLQRIAAK